MSKYTQSVERGIALLNDEEPGWRAKIDCDTLDLRDCRECVLGQVFGYYEVGLQALGIDDPTEFAFAVPDDATDVARSYTWLTKAWRKVLGCV